MFFALTALLAAIQPAGSYQGELREHLRTLPVATFASTKRAYDLKICLADVLNVVGTPIVYRDGPTDIVISVTTTAGGAHMASTKVINTEEGSRIELRVRGKGWNDRLGSRLEACL